MLGLTLYQWEIPFRTPAAMWVLFVAKKSIERYGMILEKTDYKVSVIIA
jgi:hypothetical protein